MPKCSAAKAGTPPGSMTLLGTRGDGSQSALTARKRNLGSSMLTQSPGGTISYCVLESRLRLVQTPGIRVEWVKRGYNV